MQAKCSAQDELWSETSQADKNKSCSAIKLFAKSRHDLAKLQASNHREKKYVLQIRNDAGVGELVHSIKQYDAANGSKIDESSL